MASSKDPLPSLDALQRKIDSMKPEGEEETDKSNTSTDIGKAMKMGVELMAGVGVGGVMGYWIDRALDTLPIFFIIFFFLGFAAGFRNLVRNAK